MKIITNITIVCLNVKRVLVFEFITHNVMWQFPNDE